MKKNQKKATVSITEQAATWHVELDESEHLPDRRRRFFSWLRKSPQHIEEFLAIAALQQTIAQPSQHSGSIAEILHDVSKAKQEPVVAMRPDVAEKPEVPVQDPPSRRWRPVVWASAACVAMFATFLVLWLPAADAPPRNHRTELGEQRSIALRDGSIVTLNTLSEVETQFDDTVRRVTLLSGEAMFRVSHDPDRPFVVSAGTISIDVVGTTFAIYRKHTSTQIAVVEGTVNARSNRRPGDSVELHGGEGAIATGDGLIKRNESFNMERAVAWTERRLIFDNARLADVASEFNRYNRRQLRIDDPQLADRQITTIMNAHDVSALIGFLQLQPDLEVDYGADVIRIGTVSP